jgi:hypothetical protein
MTKYDSTIQDLSNAMQGRKGKLKENQAYYESSYRLKALGLSTPPELRYMTAAIGWPRMYLDSLEERLDLEDFRQADTSESDDRLRSWWQANFLDVESGMGHLESMIHGISYVTVAAPQEDDDNPDIPIMRVESPFNFIAKKDYRTRKIKEALRVFKHPINPKEDWATLLLPDATVILARGGQFAQWRVVEEIQHDLGKVLVAELLNRERLTEAYGKSEITTELRSATDAASRIMMNLQTASELMAIPQRVLFGIEANELPVDPSHPGAAMEAYMARILAFENENGKGMQFSAADLRNFTEALQELSKQVASYTGLPPQYLSFSSENPASAEAIKSAESRLVKKAERKARMFGQGWEQAMRLGMLVMDGSIPNDAYQLESVWRDPSTPTFAAKADGVVKLHAGGIIPTEQAQIEMGYSDVQRQQFRQWSKDDPIAQMNALLVDAQEKNNAQIGKADPNAAKPVPPKAG